MKEKILGLDIGIASVGHCLIEYDDETQYGTIIHLGSRVFDPCEVPKTKEPLNAQRRAFRMTRRILSRRRGRMRAIKQLFLSKNILKEEDINNAYYGNCNRIDVWTLRKEALEKKLSHIDFYRVLHQIAKRRGFKSIRKSEEAKNSGDLLKSLSKNIEYFEQSSFRTIGEMYATIYQEDTPKRNKKESYSNSIPRYLLEDEAKLIFEKQRSFGAEFASKELEASFGEIAFFQRPIQSMKDMVGYCQFEKNEKRAPKGAYTSEIFVAAQKLLNLNIFDAQQINQIIELAHEKTKVTYKQIRKFFEIDDDFQFKGLNYNKKNKDGSIANPEDAAVIELKKYQEFKKAIIEKLGKDYFENIKYNQELFDNIAEVLTYEKSDESIVEEMNKKDIPTEIIDAVKDCSTTKVLHLSIKAMKNIIPFMLEGHKYNEACELAGYNFRNDIVTKGLNYLPVLPKEEMTTNPVVNRSISQVRKVVNALIKEYGLFDRIIIETARDLGKSVEERNRIKAGQDDFKKQKEEAKKRCIEKGLDPEYGNNLLKYRLLEEQDFKCIYSQKQIDLHRLDEIGYLDIDHIIPYSRSFDDSLNNKVVCLADENRQKGNKLPYEYLAEKVNWYEYTQWIKSLHLNNAKQNRILRQSYESGAEGFLSRNLNDTRYITVFIKDYLKEYLDCKIETRNGSLTAFLRNQWGINKNRNESDRHHAIDAAVLACSTQGMVKYLSTVAAKRENYDFINKSKTKFKPLWETFNEDLENSVNNLFVSRALVTKISGGIHEATLRSPKHLSEGFTTLKTDITDLSLEKLENLFDKDRNRALYNVLKERLEQYSGDGKKAFAEPVFMPLSKEKTDKGQKPHQIKTVKLMTKGTAGILLPNGFAKNDSMPRVDVFSKANKKGKKEYFLVPIYVSDFARGILPNLAIAPLKPAEEWTKIDDTFNFEFSLFKNSLISLNKTGKTEDQKMYYFKGVHRATGRINVIEIDNSQTKDITIGVKAMAEFKKYQVDVLGNYYEIKHEKRRSINLKGVGILKQ